MIDLDRGILASLVDMGWVRPQQFIDKSQIERQALRRLTAGGYLQHKPRASTLGPRPHRLYCITHRGLAAVMNERPALPRVTGAQIRAGVALVNMQMKVLSAKSGYHLAAIRENISVYWDRPMPQKPLVDAVITVLQVAGVEFVPRGVLLRTDSSGIARAAKLKGGPPCNPASSIAPQT